MIIRANKLMCSILSLRMEEIAKIECKLPQRLRGELEEVECCDYSGLITYSGLSLHGVERDLTGEECRLNKWHMDMYYMGSSPSFAELTRVGIRYAVELQRRIHRMEIEGDLRLIVSAAPSWGEECPETCTVYFHRLRPENPWFMEDIETYTREGVLTLDWSNPRR